MVVRGEKVNRAGQPRWFEAIGFRAGKGNVMRFGWSWLVLLAVVGCAPSVPESGAGFETYPEYLRNREAGVAGSAPLGINGPVVGTETLGSTTLPTPSESRDSIPAGIARQSGEMDAVGGIPGENTASISDTQDFQAVSARETRESNAAKIAQQRATYQQIAPTALPPRSGTDGPSIVQFALQTTNRLGEAVYSRTNPFRDKQSLTACAKFASSDQAQEEFLLRGGPERDPKSLDPDGDGFACFWDPTPFRSAVN